jgi:Ca2+-binding RTX toxin-like protein
MSALLDGLFDIYRFFNTQTGTHFYTASEAERDSIIANMPHMTFEGNPYDSNGIAGNTTGDVPVYRFFNSSTGAHHYTTSEVERASIIQNLPQFAFEGIAYYAFSDADIERTALFRFYNTATATHFYTTSEAERDAILATLPQFSFEGIAYYVGGINAGPQIDASLSGISGAVEMTADSQTSSSFLVGGGTAAPSAPASPGTPGNSSGPYYSVTRIEPGDYFQVVTTTAGAGTAGASGFNGGNGGTALSFTAKTDTASDTLNLSLKGGVIVSGGAGGDSDTQGGNGGTAIFAQSFDIVNVASNGSSANTIIGGAAGEGTGVSGFDGASLVLAQNATVLVTGTQDLNLGTLSGLGTTVNAAPFTGALSVVGDAGNNTIIGGSGNDTLDGAAGQDRLTGGAGSDIFQIFLGETPTGLPDTITDFNAGGTADSIRSASIDTVAGAAGVTPVAGTTVAVSAGGKATFAAADDTLAEILVTLDADDTNVGLQEVVFFELGADTYVYYENATGSGDEQLIRLENVTGLVSITEVGSFGDFQLA